MTDAVAAAMARAEAAQAEAGANPPSTNTAVAPVAGTAVAAGGAPRSLADLVASAGTAVDFYLGVNEFGISYDKQPNAMLVAEVFGKFRFKDTKAGFNLRVSTPGQVKYFTSYDGYQEAKTRANWQALIVESQRLDPKCYVSDLLEVPLTLTQALPRKGGAEAKVGTVVGVSLSYKNYQYFQSFLTENFSKYGMEDDVYVRLTHEARVGGGQSYGTYKFEVVDPAVATGNVKAGKK